jgi:hypothetical protein
VKVLKSVLLTILNLLVTSAQLNQNPVISQGEYAISLQLQAVIYVTLDPTTASNPVIK